MTTILVHFFLEDVEVVGGCHGDDIFLRVPGGVQDLLVEVQAVHADFVFLPFATGADLAGFKHGTGFTVLPRRLQCDVPARVPVKHPKEIVVGTRHNGTEKDGIAGADEMREKKKKKKISCQFVAHDRLHKQFHQAFEFFLRISAPPFSITFKPLVEPMLLIQTNCDAFKLLFVSA